MSNYDFFCFVIRNKSRLTFISMLLLGAMTLADTRFFYLEQEEALEICEVEREELKEKAEGERHWSKWLLSGGADYSINDSLVEPLLFVNHITEVSKLNYTAQKSSTALFVMYCCLKIPLS